MLGRRYVALLLSLIVIALLQLPALAQAPAPAPAAAPAAPATAVAPTSPGLPPGTIPGGQLSLEEAIAIALRNNPSITIASQEVTANQGLIQQAKSAALPHLRTEVIGTSGFTGVSFGGGVAWQPNLVLTQPIFTWGAIRQGIRAANALLESARSSQVRTADTVTFLARQSYYQVLAAQQSVRVQQDVLSAAQEHLRIANLRYEAGVAPQYDVLAAQARVARVEQTLASASGGLNTAYASLSQVLACEVPPNTALSTPRPLTATEEPLPTLVSQAMECRADVQSARAQVAVREAQLAVARVGNYPRIDLTASYALRKVESVPGFPTERGSAVIATNWNIYTGGQIQGEIRTAKARAEQARQQVRQVQLQAEDDVKNAYFGMQTAQAQVQAAEQEVAQAQEAYRIAQVRYQEGVSTSVEVLDAQSTLGDARNRLNDAIFALNLAVAQLGLAVGGGTPPGAPAASTATTPTTATTPGVVTPGTATPSTAPATAPAPSTAPGAIGQ